MAMLQVADRLRGAASVVTRIEGEPSRRSAVAKGAKRFAGAASRSESRGALARVTRRSR